AVSRKPPEKEPPEPELKERVLHTRVPERLEAELRERAAALGISVSNLVHTARLVQHVGVRLDAFALDLARDVGAVVRDAQALTTAAIDQAADVGRATPRATRLAT